MLADVAEAVEDIDHGMIANRIEDLQNRIAKSEPGFDLDKLITQLDHYKEVHRHLTATAMH